MRTRCRGLLGGEPFTIYPVRGEYAELTPAKRSLVNGLVYPLPHAGHGLGVHLMRTTGGAVWLGPTVSYQERKDDYENDRLPVEAFRSSRRGVCCPTITHRRPAAVGQRHPRQAAPADRVVRRFHDPARHARIPRVVQAAGIDSPGLTSCLAVGNVVSALVPE